MGKNGLIILGGGLKGKELNEHTRSRYDKGIKIEKKFDYIICSTGQTYRNEGLRRKISEAEAGETYLIKKGVDKNKIIIENDSSDTFSNAYYCRKIVDRLKMKKFTVVTSRFHMAKARFLFKVVFPAGKYKIKFVKSKNGKLSRLALKNRKVHERMVLNFYKKHLSKTYGVKKGDMKSIKNFLEKYNLATSGRMDKYQKELTRKINERLDKRAKLLY